MNKDLIYIQGATQSVASGSPIVLPTILRRRGCSLVSFGSGVLAKTPGYYKVSGTVTFTTPTAGTATISIAKNGASVPGIVSSVTTSGTAATTDVKTLSYSGIVRVYCGESDALLTLSNDGVAIDVTNATLEIE